MLNFLWGRKPNPLPLTRQEGSAIARAIDPPSTTDFAGEESIAPESDIQAVVQKHQACMKAEVGQNDAADSQPVGLGARLLKLDRMWLSLSHREGEQIGDPNLFRAKGRPDVEAEHAPPHPNLPRDPDPKGFAFTEYTECTVTQPFEVKAGRFGGAIIRVVWLYTPDIFKLRITDGVSTKWAGALVDEDDVLVGWISVEIRKVKGGLFETSLLRGAGNGVMGSLKIEKTGDMKYQIRKALAEDRLPIMSAED